ncbi:response regulator [Azoarcus indigens]|uniref:Two-component system chemotaxis response regulator CheY n=1 Tax=Azoarcus indigens TaxID=29545 RepID=A0A4R6DD97_9RHOO|nr:response regulator [Azoarcus indigens]NMG68115.1 response regulator [Azoarcus indigens]TDN42353.1 two-component system chemotaxis response regulator CheY [Azoarcus indigens]
MAKTILIVDDSASIRMVVKTALTGAGYEVIEAADGQDALARLDGRKINLVISDVNMPRLDGIGFLRQMKQKPGYQFTPVIMLTTESEADKMRQGKEAGAKAWVVKPFQPAQMLAAVAKLIQP